MDVSTPCHFCTEGEILDLDRAEFFQCVWHSSKESRYVGSVSSHGIGNGEVADIP
jgi:hypothetical protein